MAQGHKKKGCIALSLLHGSGAFDCENHGDESRPKVRDELIWNRDSGARGYSGDRQRDPDCYVNSCRCQGSVERSVRELQTGSSAVHAQCVRWFSSPVGKKLTRAAVEAATVAEASNNCYGQRSSTEQSMDFTTKKTKGHAFLNFYVLVMRCPSDALGNL